MNYIREINAFYDWLETNWLPSPAIALWHALMHVNNKAGWIPEFAVAISTLEAKTGLQRSAVNRARNTLQLAGRITFKSRSGRQSAIYSIIPFEDCGVLSDTNRPQTDHKPTTKCNTNRPRSEPINKLNKTKLNNIDTLPPKPPVQKIQYADFVRMTEVEYQKLVDKYGQAMTSEMIEILNNYKGANGKQYKSDYLAILNWVVDRVNERRGNGKLQAKGKAGLFSGISEWAEREGLTSE